MKRFPGRSRDNSQIRAEATEWLIGFCENDVDQSGLEEFHGWLRSSPEHVRAYLQIAAVWEAAGSLNLHRRLEIEDLVRIVAAERKVIPLLASREVPAAGNRRTGRFWWPALAACFLVVTAASLVFSRYGFEEASVHSTAVGEQRRVVLEDGSSIMLDARSSVRVKFQKSLRLVELLEGQALFDVESDPSWPFVVSSGTARIRAVGTQFDVNRVQSDTVVTVVEGSVEVAAEITAEAPSRLPKDAPHTTMLAVGEQTRVNATSILPPQHTDVSMVTAWSNGRLVFDSTPLGEVIDTVNRYSPRLVVIDAPELLQLHMSGSFSIADTATIIRFLERRFELTVSEVDTRIILSRS